MVALIEDIILTFLRDHLERLIVDEMTLAKLYLRTPNVSLVLLRLLHFLYVLRLGRTYATHLLQLLLVRDLFVNVKTWH